MKKVSLLIFAIVFFAISSISFAANHYVRPSGITYGTSSGADWNNAYTDIPATLVRGDTYYIADGNYAPYNIDDAVSGVQYITVKKATIADHGTNIGWDNTYGDGQAVFSAIAITTSYIIFDGINGGGADKTSYGFYLYETNCASVPPSPNQQYMIYMGTAPLQYVTISHTAMEACGGDWKNSFTQTGIKFNSIGGPSPYLTVSNNYFEKTCDSIAMYHWTDSIIENNYFNGNWSGGIDCHGTFIAAGSSCNDIILRNNVFNNGVGGSGILGVHRTDNNRWQIYNNIIIGNPGRTAISLAFGAVDTTSAGDVVKNFQFHHNTFYNVVLGSAGVLFTGLLSDNIGMASEAYNNLFYNTHNPSFKNSASGASITAIVHSHNAFFSTTCVDVSTCDYSEGGTAQVGTGDPFVDSANNNFTLKAPTNPGKVLASPYKVDKNNYTRGLDNNNWDRGAYEFKKPEAPQGIQ